MSPDCAFYTFAVEQVEPCLIMSCCVLQTMTDVVGNPEEERRAEFYYQPWAQEAVCRYFYSKVIDLLSSFLHRVFCAVDSTPSYKPIQPRSSGHSCIKNV